MKGVGASHRLFDRWREVVSAMGDELALTEFSTGRRWTFRELMRESESGGANDSEIAFPSGNDAAFIFRILRAWRIGLATCPLEISQRRPSLPPPPKDFAHVKLSSASTGAAKAIVFTPDQLAADVQNIVSTMGLDRTKPNLACISLSHSYGFSNLVLPLVLHGIPLILVPAPLPQTIVNAARSVSRITLPAVPALWRSWYSSGAIPSNVSLAISAGAPLPLDLEKEIFRASGLKVHNFYGSSECGGIAFDRSREPRTEAALAGTAMENVRLSLSEAGTLVVESAAVGTTYWPEPLANLSAPRFETSDLAEIRDGAAFLRGRLGDVINIAGRKAAPEIIENALRAHPAIKECVVFGTQDSRFERGESVVAVLSTSAILSIAQLAEFLSTRLPPWQIPREWWFTEELVANERGKISRAEWKGRFERRVSGGPRASSASS